MSSNKTKNQIVKFISSHSQQWIGKRLKIYAQKIANIIKEYALKVNIAEDFREEWNSSHPSYEQYQPTAFSAKTDFANGVGYKIVGDQMIFFNNAQAGRPMWGVSIPRPGDLSNWIIGDTEHSYIHPIPPYINLGGGRKVFKVWFEKSEWKKMWYTADPYIQNALKDERIKQIQKECLNDYLTDFKKAYDKWANTALRKDKKTRKAEKRAKISAKRK